MNSVDPIEIAFFKMEGCGNDYVYLDMDLFKADHRQRIEEGIEDLACQISDRHFGVGGDGLVLVAREGDHDGRMRMFNSDGSESGICGNALRCVAKYLAECGDEPLQSMEIHTGSGIKKTELRWQDQRVTEVRADMGAPIFDAALIPFEASALPATSRLLGGGQDSPLALELDLQGEVLPAYVLSMGNPHLVIFTDRDPLDQDLTALAAPLESDPMFPERTNVELVQVQGKDRVLQRTFERGSGETLACGSGACAVGVAAVARGLLSRGQALTVDLLGGTLLIEWSEEGSVFMTGPATHVFEGVFHYQP